MMQTAPDQAQSLSRLLSGIGDDHYAVIQY